jgi:hypothetical protein
MTGGEWPAASSVAIAAEIAGSILPGAIETNGQAAAVDAPGRAGDLTG